VGNFSAEKLRQRWGLRGLYQDLKRQAFLKNFGRVVAKVGFTMLAIVLSVRHDLLCRKVKLRGNRRFRCVREKVFKAGREGQPLLV
jgi:hypothetical protein